jgi:3alpha(or 20beta)-hydroxysteroid dehydrogenase
MNVSGNGDLSKKVVLITGGARGIGAASVQRCVEEGAHVVIADRRAAECAALAVKMNGLREDSALAINLDIGIPENWPTAVEKTIAHFGRLDVLVNNAGIIRVMPFATADVETFRKIIDINLIGTFLGMQAVIEPMKKAGGGSIINFSSVQGFEGRAGLSLYSATKFGIRGLTKTAAIELGEFGIRVNTIIPGPTRTKMTERDGWEDEDYNRAYSKYPLGRMGQAQELAEMVVFLASSKSSFCTGADFVVDGGLLAGKPRD